MENKNLQSTHISELISYRNIYCQSQCSESISKMSSVDRPHDESPLFATPERPRKRPWRKLLWVHQPYPDNYVDVSFLSQLKRNMHVQQYSFWALSSDSTVIISHVSTVALFVCVFVVIYNFDWNPAWFAFSGSGFTLIGYFVWDYLGNNTTSRSKRFHTCIFIDILANLLLLAATSKSALLIVSTLLGLSPVLKSLTQSTSSDSIWAISVWLFLLNIFFHDYSVGPRKTFVFITLFT